MSRSYIFIALFVVLGLLGLIILAPFIIPASSYKTQVESLIEDNTGWRIRFGGDVSIGVFPSVRLMAQDIEISPPNNDPILNAKEARFALGLSALFQGAVNIEEILLRQPEITIALGNDGNPVWLEPSSGNATENSTIEQEGENSSGNIVDSLITKLSVERFSIEEATIRYGKIGEDFSTLSNLSIAASLPDPQGPLNLDGSALFNGDPVSLSGEITDFKSLLAQQDSQINLLVGYKQVTAQLNGLIAPQGDTIFDGAVDLEAQNLADLLGKPDFQGSLSASGTVTAGKEKAVLSFPNGKFSDTTFSINLDTDLSSEKPLIFGAIDLGILNLTPFLGEQTQSDKRADEQAPSRPSSQQATNSEPDLSALLGFNADVSFSAQKILLEDKEVTQLKGAFILSNGQLALELNNLEAAGGRAQASLSADINNAPLITYGSLKTENLSVPLLVKLSGQDLKSPTVDGLLNTDLVFGFQGLSAAEILETANARGSLSLNRATISKTGLGAALDDPSADRFDNLSLKLTINGLDAPVLLNANTNWRGEQISLSAQTKPLPLINGQSAPTEAQVSFSKAKITYNGAVSLGLPANGTISVEGQSLRSLASWMKVSLPESKGYGKFRIKTAFSATPTKLSLQNLDMLLDAIKGQGNVEVGLSGKPNINAAFRFQTLDLEPYLAATGQAAPSSNASNATIGSSSAWSNAPIDFSFAHAANLNLEARVGTLKAGGLTVGPVNLKTTLQNGLLTSNLSEMGFYDGKATANVTLDARSEVPKIAAKLNASGIQGYPFLKDAADFEHIEGTLNYRLDITSQGRSEAQIVSALNGATSFDFSNGAIRGINIAKAMRRLTSGSLNGWNNVSDEKTDFSSFKASFNIQNGIASNNDLNLVGPLVRVKGSGSVNMPNQTIDYRVDPKVVASLQGQGGQDDLAGFAVPIIIKGPWAKPRIYPDIKGFLQDPQAGLAKLKSLGGGFAKIANSKPADLVASLGNNPKGAALNKVGSAIQKKTGVDVGALLQDGKISKEGGAAAAIGIVGGLLGKRQNNTSTPLQAGEIPQPRPKPQRTNRPANAVGTVLQQVLKPQNNQGQQNQNTGQPQNGSEKILRGLNNFLNR